MMGEHGGREFFDFAECRRLPPQRFKGNARRFDARANRQIIQIALLSTRSNSMRVTSVSGLAAM